MSSGSAGPTRSRFGTAILLFPVQERLPMRISRVLVLIPLLAGALPAQRPWQQITFPSVRDVAANFKAPPHEYGAIQPFTSWNGPDAGDRKARIVQDLDRLAAKGIFVVKVSPRRGEPLYLTPEHMDQMKFVVQEAAKRGMKIWLQDESDYPSGFAGGKIKKLYPELGMQGIVADIRVRVAPGQTLTMPAPSDMLAIYAVKSSPDQQVQGVVPIPVPADGQLKWTVPYEGNTPNEPRLSWEVVFVRHIYVSSPTRNFNREDGTRAKDGYYTLIDYLAADATRAFLKITHETYRQAIGDEFGKTVLGFFGDEPDYSIAGSPWTPKLLEEFQARKGYDLKPYIAQFFAGKLSDEAQRAKADYWDVWSGIFQNTFFGEQAAWCHKYNIEYLVHLNHEETMTSLVRSEGDFFRDMRKVGVPGIDNLSQLLPSLVHTPDGTWRINNNFPKLASSAAHLFGRPKVWTEGAGGPGIDGKYQMDFQLVRGVTELQIRVPGGGGPGGGASSPSPQGPMLALYANRGGYLMATGRPAAQVGLYHPVNSMWMGDDQADPSTTKLGWQLYDHQVEWDYFDEQSLSSVATIAHGNRRRPRHDAGVGLGHGPDSRRRRRRCRRRFGALSAGVGTLRNESRRGRAACRWRWSRGFGAALGVGHYSGGTGRGLDVGPQRQTDDHSSEILGGAGRAIPSGGRPYIASSSSLLQCLPGRKCTWNSPVYTTTPGSG